MDALVRKVPRAMPKNSAISRSISLQSDVIKLLLNAYTTQTIRSKGTHSSNIWLQRQIKDPYVKQAQLEDYRCRSAYKLKEIQKRYKIFTRGNVVIDCGAAPGSWSQVAAKSVKSFDGHGKVIGLDLLPVEPLKGVTFFSGKDFTTEDTQNEVLEALEGRLANVVMSDMAPNASGNKNLDHDAICDLCVAVLKFSAKVLDKDGHVLCKIWDGNGKTSLLNTMDRMFNSTTTVRPKACRLDSSELYLLGQKFKLR